jgi:hypothetical protein
MNEYRAMVEWYLQGKTSPNATSSTPNSTWTDAVANPGLQSERPVTNHLSHVEVPLTLSTQPPNSCWSSPNTRHTTTSPNCSAHNMLLNSSATVYAESQNYCSGRTFQQETHIPLCCTAGNVRSAVHSSLAPLAIAQWHPLHNAVVSVSADQLSCLQMWSFSSKRNDSNTTKLYPWQTLRAHEPGNASVQKLTAFPYFT